MTRHRRAAAGSTLALAVTLAAAASLCLDRALAQEKTDAAKAEKTEKPEKLEKQKKAAEPFYRKFLVPGASLDDRIREQEKKVEENPNSADLRNDLGNLLAERRFPKEAREQYQTAMKLDKHNWMAPYNLGLLEEIQGNPSGAMSAYEKSVDRNRGFPPSRFRLGRLYERAGRTSDAVREYSKALEIDPQMRDVRYNPLVADTNLLERISLTNYKQDLVRSVHRSDAAWADERFGRPPVERPLFSNELRDLLEPEPVDSTGHTVPRSPAPLPPRAGETRPQDFGSRPAAPPPPSPQPVQPTPVPPPVNDPLMLSRPQPLPTPLPQ